MRRQVLVRLLLGLIAVSLVDLSAPMGTEAVYTDEPWPRQADRSVQATSEKPNIVVLMLDDYAAADHRVLERLPNIKALFLQQGLEALNYWGNDPLCCPGRANFLTAQNAHHSGVVRNDARLLDARETIATELDEAGYYTNVCGKYLNLTHKLLDRSPAGWDNVAIMSKGYYRYTAYVNDVEEYHGSADSDYSTDVFANHCLAFLEAAPVDAPVFMWMTPYATHKGREQDGTLDRYEAAPAPRHRGDARCSGIARWRPANYNSKNLSDKPLYMQKRPRLPWKLRKGIPLVKKCRSLLSVDDWLGRVVDELKAQGRYENTIFVLTADNGMGWGSFRWERKVAPHTAQLSLFIHWPVLEPTSLVQDSTLLMNVDLAPTLCEFAGCVMGPYHNGLPADGQSFAGIIDPGLLSSVPVRESVVLEQRGNSKTPIWRALMTDPATHPLGGQWFYIWYKTGETELYDISGGPCYAWTAGSPGDPCMLVNKSGDGSYSAIKSQLAAELATAW